LEDACLEALLRERDWLLAQNKRASDSRGRAVVGPEFDERVSLFVNVAALSIFLEGAKNFAEIAYEVKTSPRAFHRDSFQKAVDELDKGVREDFLEALRTEEQTRRDGNGG
jgi:hypothetical protein